MRSHKLTNVNITTEQDCFKLEDTKQEDMKIAIANSNPSKIMFFHSPKGKRNRKQTSIPVGDYYKPFEKGWKRELVVRSYVNANGRAPCDVYYRSPTGKKFRSLKEIELHLTDSELSVNDFSFLHKLVGINDPDLETFRHAQPRKKVIDTDLETFEHAQPRKKVINASTLEKYQNDDLETYTTTSSGRKGKRPKCLEDYMIDNIIHKVCKSRKRSKTNLKASVPSNAIFSLNNDEPSTSAGNGGSLYVIADKRFDISSLNTLNYLSKIEITSSSETEFVVVSDLTHLCTLTSLTSLKLTHIQNLSLLNIEEIANLTNLEYLCLGNCNNFPNKFGTNVLNRLKNLKTLRLEGGQNTCVLNILKVVGQMICLEQLELLNFDIPLEFGKALTACKNIKKLLLIPIYEMKAHLIIHAILKALIDWQQLKCFTFVIIESLINSTKQFNKMHGLNIGDSVPILESVPAFYVDDNSPNTSKGKLPLRRRFTPNPLNVEFIAVSRLQFLFEKLLPGARIKIVTAPDSEILKQSL